MPDNIVAAQADNVGPIEGLRTASTQTLSSVHDSDWNSEIDRSLLLEEYRTLRNEIAESIKHQHQILLSGYAAALATFAAPQLREAFLASPGVLFIMTALWASECNRMVRAGYYIAFFLWPDICGRSYRGANWEKWVRCGRGNHESIFRNSQNDFQRVVVFWGPFIASMAAWIYALWIYALPEFQKAPPARSVPMLVLPIAYVLILPCWYWLWKRVRDVSYLGGVVPTDMDVTCYSSEGHVPGRDQPKS